MEQKCPGHTASQTYSQRIPHSDCKGVWEKETLTLRDLSTSM